MILVTGATGQIGSKITEGLIQSKADVRVFVRDENRLGDLKMKIYRLLRVLLRIWNRLKKRLRVSIV